MAVSFDTEIQFLKGIGEKRAALLHKLGIDTVGDLLNHYPRDYIDLTEPVSALSADPTMPCAVRAMVLSKSGEQHIRKGLSVFKVRAVDPDGTELLLTFFNSKFTVDKLQVDEEYVFYGKVSGSLLRREMNTPLIFTLAEARQLIPVYPQTAGINSRFLAAEVRLALSGLLETLEETIPADIKVQNQLCHLQYAIENIHFPASRHDMLIARRRLIFEELFTLSLALSAVRTARDTPAPVAMQPVEIKDFLGSLPFALTEAQLRSVREICGDLAGSTPMNRLLQGDVGSGKTMVAAYGAWLAAKNGGQCALMAPTELLAEQHFRSLAPLLGRAGVRVGLLTGSQPAAVKKQVQADLAAGDIDFIVGTHALLSEGVVFHRLGLVITDEQHRFGVAQRATLAAKGANPHMLVMSATPIPRTLALIVYGDLDVSILDELPPGRQPIETYAVDTGKRERAYNYIKKHIAEGRQAYIVCPLVEDGEEETASLVSATAYFDQLASGPFRGYSLGLLHGRMKAAEKDRVMSAFARGDIAVLVSTTVIEVGVDVPNAVLMVIENAERFGLAQLHQLRGRVGRGVHRSTCILISDAQNEEARRRLQVMCATNDGFRIADEDLKLRGPGDFFGRRQHGLPDLKIADLDGDMPLFREAQAAAVQLTGEDPELAAPENRLLAEEVRRLFETSFT